MTQDLESMVAVIHEKICNWDKNGFPACAAHNEQIKTLEWRTKLIIAAMVLAGLTAVGGCI